MNAALDDLFGALADPTRRAILDRLRSGEASAGDLARPFAMSQPAVSRHLATLQNAGLVTQSAPRVPGSPLARQQAVTVLASRQAMVIGPTPPGTGVIAPAATARSCRSQPHRPRGGSCPRNAVSGASGRG
jgi:DNA-binding transcriptional ArsR family regulator